MTTPIHAIWTRSAYRLGLQLARPLRRPGSRALLSLTIIHLCLAITTGALAVDPHVDTALTPATPLPDADMVIVRERFYGSGGVDLSAYGITGGPHTYVQSLYFRLFVDQNSNTVDSYSALVVLPDSVTILGIITGRQELGGSNDDGIFTDSDAIFGIGTDPDAYSENARGFEIAGSASSEYIGIINDHTFAFSLHVAGGLDDFRIIIDYGDSFAPDLSFDLLAIDVVPPEDAVLLAGVHIGDIASPTVPPGAGDHGETPSLLDIPLTALAEPTPGAILPFVPEVSLYIARDLTGPTYVDSYDTELNVPLPTQFLLSPIISNPRGITDHDDGLIYCTGRDGNLGVIDPTTRVVATTVLDDYSGNVVDSTNLPGHEDLFLIRDTSGDSQVDVMDRIVPEYVATYAIPGVATPVAIVDGSDGLLYVLNQNGRLGWISAAGDTTSSMDLDPPAGSYDAMTSRPGSNLLYLLRDTSAETKIDIYDVTTQLATFDFATLPIPLSPGDITDGPDDLLYVIGDGSGGPAGYTIVDPVSGSIVYSHEIMDFSGAYRSMTALGLQVATDVETTSILAPKLDHFAWPNPFNPRVELRYALARPGQTQVSIFDVRGRLVRELHRGWEPAGWAQQVWDGRDQAGKSVSSGIYLYQIRTADTEATGKLTLVK